MLRNLPSLAAMVHFASALASLARPGDVIALSGALGAGKTTFARAFIRARIGAVEVPSPTYTLVQTYEDEDAMLWHFDLYRLSAPEEIHELGIEEAMIDGILLIEWPERLGPLMPTGRLAIALAQDPASAEGRIATLDPSDIWRARLATLPERFTP